MILSELKSSNELSDCLDSCKDGILSFKGMFPKEYFESSSILMFTSIEVREGAGKLIEVVKQKIDEVVLFFLHIIINIS